MSFHFDHTFARRLGQRIRQAWRLRCARVAVRRAARSAERRQRAASPGYDELSDPVFLVVMALAIVVLFIDLRGDEPGSVSHGRSEVAVSADRGGA